MSFSVGQRVALIGTEGAVTGHVLECYPSEGKVFVALHFKAGQQQVNTIAVVLPCENLVKAS